MLIRLLLEWKWFRNFHPSLFSSICGFLAKQGANGYDGSITNSSLSMGIGIPAHSPCSSESDRSVFRSGAKLSRLSIASFLASGCPAHGNGRAGAACWDSTSTTPPPISASSRARARRSVRFSRFRIACLPICHLQFICISCLHWIKICNDVLKLGFVKIQGTSELSRFDFDQERVTSAQHVFYNPCRPNHFLWIFWIKNYFGITCPNI